jgi:hypothetical protein
MHRLFTHILLTLAAVLLIPQALDCCAHAHTVLESLAAGDERAEGTSQSAHMRHHGDVHAAAPPAEPARDGLDRSQVPTVLSPSGSGSAQQAPSDGAGLILPFGDGFTSTSVRLPSAASGIPAGWTDRPASPPPR